MEDATRNTLLRSLPSIDELLSRPSLAPLLSSEPRPLVVEALRTAVETARARLIAGDPVGFDEADVHRALQTLKQPNLRKVLNATGVVLHTNLGRAPLSLAALARIAEVGAGYCNLELDLEEGERGSRYQPVIELLCRLTGAEDALVVNNCAASVLLAFSALAQGREAIVSRGELVEIGGGFRIPDVMRQSGARMIEVGTTNRTRLADFAEAIGPDTGLLVKVHRSNFALVGFTEEASTRELAGLAREKGIVLFEDLGSGALTALHAEGLTSEPTVATVVSAGADLVAFSGDKLLGGPQAGILVGRRGVIAALRKHPLNRALRIDKLTVAALEATLEAYRDGAEDLLPVRALLKQPRATLEARAQRLLEQLLAQQVDARLIVTTGQVGGGAMPLASLPSFACAIGGANAEALHQRLRAAQPPVVARIADGLLLLDVRCLRDDELSVVARAVAAAVPGS
ncbi:MAG: L-seryl-tRNA selenium transferase [Myxococcaceae bacterium]|nr:L-seryl-tRNA selenium transferase [Myxococcaceae bacterium]